VTELLLYGRRVDSVFQLLGAHEDDITFSLGWGLAQSPAFLRVFLLRVVHYSGEVEDVSLQLQRHEADAGRTDLEIIVGTRVHVIIEAKRGWNLPSEAQLEKYATRDSFVTSPTSAKLIVVLSECSSEFVCSQLGVQVVRGILVTSASWLQVAQMAREAFPNGDHAEKRLLSELIRYLGGIMNMRKADSNLAYVVALATGYPEGATISWIDIVKEKKHYFHPVGNGWPKEPPNYVAFRYFGKLQSIQHVDEYKVVTNLHLDIPEMPDEQVEPHFLYSLGPAIEPAHEVRTGRIYRNGRVWCMLDTLLTCNTISEAKDLSAKRLKLGQV
jgi:hypothetical protein